MSGVILKYIEIKDGFSVRIDAIEAIEKVNELECIVRTQFNSYDSVFPYLVLLQLLEKEEMPEPTEMEKETFNILKETGVTSP